MNGCQSVALGLSLLTSSIIFFRRTFVLNKFSKTFRWYVVVLYVISIFSGLLFWTTLRLFSTHLIIQIIVGFISTILGWLSLVLLVNDRLQYPTNQQLIALLFYIATETLSLLQVRFVFTCNN